MRRSTIIICLVSIVLLAGGIAALVFWPESEPEQVITTPIPVSERADLINERPSQVESVLFMPADGSPYTLRQDLETFDITLDVPDAIFQGEEYIVFRIFSNAVNLANLTIVTQDASSGDLATFGLDAPVMTWRVFLVDGSASDYELGGLQAAGRGRYARESGSSTVYLLPETQSIFLTRYVEDLYDISFMPYEIVEAIAENSYILEYILLDTGDDIIELRRRTDEEMSVLSLGSSYYVMLQPTQGDGNDSMIQSMIAEKVATIAPISVEAVRPDDLSIYGLDNPARLELSVGEYWSAVILIGDREIERGGRYVMLEGYDAVLFDADGDYSFLNVSSATLRSRLVWLFNIVDVSYLTYELEGVKRTLRLEHPANDDESMRGWLDDNEILESNARRLYSASLSVIQSGVTDLPIPNAPPVYSITIHFLDGTDTQMDLYSLNDSQFLMVHDGENTGFYITRMALYQNFLSRFEILDRGEDLPR